MTYLYVFEDGSIKWDDEGPTDVDVKSVEDGTLSVINLSTLEELDCLGNWVKLQQAEIAATHGCGWHE